MSGISALGPMWNTVARLANLSNAEKVQVCSHQKLTVRTGPLKLRLEPREQDKQRGRFSGIYSERFD